jgi:hypothetical protein
MENGGRSAAAKVVAAGRGQVNGGRDCNPRGEDSRDRLSVPLAVRKLGLNALSARHPARPAGHLF